MELTFPLPTRHERVPVMPEPGTRFRRDDITFVLEGYDVIGPSLQRPRRLTRRFVEVPNAIPHEEY